MVRSFARKEEHPEADLWIAPFSDREPRRFTSGNWLDEAPRPSPDSSRVAFLSDRAARGEKSLYVIPIDGGEALRIFEEQGDVSEPSWSPDGRFVAAWGLDGLQLVDVASGAIQQLSRDASLGSVSWGD